MRGAFGPERWARRFVWTEEDAQRQGQLVDGVLEKWLAVGLAQLFPTFLKLAATF